MTTSAPRVFYDPNTPVTAHDGFASALYGESLAFADSVLNVASGHTDLAADLQARGADVQVTSLDPIYGRSEFDSRPDMVAGYAQKMPFEDGKFDVTLCQFGLQHLPPEEQAKAIREMVRVTREADPKGIKVGGVVLINPVFRPKAMLEALEQAGIEGVAGLMTHDPKSVALSQRRLVKPTLWVEKNPTLTSEKLDVLVQAITGSKALKPTFRSLGERACRANGGYSYV